MACPPETASRCAPGAAAAWAAGPGAPRARAAGPDVASASMAIIRTVISSAGGSPSMEGRSMAWGREGGPTINLHGEAATAVFTCEEERRAASRVS